MQRLFKLTPTVTASAYRLYSHKYKLNTGQVFFISLDTNLLPGDYHLEFTLEQGSEGFISVGSQQYGKLQPYWVYKEVDVTH